MINVFIWVLLIEHSIIYDGTFIILKIIFIYFYNILYEINHFYVATINGSKLTQTGTETKRFFLLPKLTEFVFIPNTAKH